MMKSQANKERTKNEEGKHTVKIVNIPTVFTFFTKLM